MGNLTNINTQYNTRSPSTFSLNIFKNNIAYCNPIVRMCRLHNEITEMNDGKLFLKEIFSHYRFKSEVKPFLIVSVWI